VGFLSLFVKLTLQTNKKLGLKNLQWMLLHDETICSLYRKFYLNCYD
jgi:hypothetical protein